MLDINKKIWQLCWKIKKNKKKLKKINKLNKINKNHE